MPAVCSLFASPDSANVLGNSRPFAVAPPPIEDYSASPHAAAILCRNPAEEKRDFASFFTDGNAARFLPSDESGDTGPVVLGGFWPPLSLSTAHCTNPSFEVSPSSKASATSPLMQTKFANGGGGYNSGDGAGTSGGSCSSNDGISSSSSITRSREIPNSISDKQAAWGNYSIWDHHLQGYHGWADQGRRQRRPGDSSHMGISGSKNYEHHADYVWNSYQLAHMRPLVMLPYMPLTMPIFLPPPPPQPFYCHMPNAGFLPPMYMLPAHPHPEHCKGHPFGFPPASLPAPPPIPFSLEGHKRALIMKQIEFYFSVENLRTDFYLKMHMDSFGWVSIHLIAGFRRIRRLTDNISLILDALIPSTIVEVERERVRRRHGWNVWVPKPPRCQITVESEQKA